jgi:hypothetical protein
MGKIKKLKLMQKKGWKYQGIRDLKYEAQMRKKKFL